METTNNCISAHIGSSLDDFLKEEGIFEQTQTQAVKEMIAWQLTQAMAAQSLSKTRMAAMLQTSRSQLDRLLDPHSDVTLSTLERAAALVGRKLSITLV
ncbi:Fis family transcriptional regulator [Janthinobacterium sp. Mn2066]|uniref:Fis family transcriptional regulator n=1 Tax=Janthinobacterium sp. Mn2066 TaxID=3395264 RepID=UPI003BC3151D